MTNPGDEDSAKLGRLLSLELELTACNKRLGKTIIVLSVAAELEQWPTMEKIHKALVLVGPIQKVVMCHDTVNHIDSGTHVQ